MHNNSKETRNNIQIKGKKSSPPGPQYALVSMIPPLQGQETTKTTAYSKHNSNAPQNYLQEFRQQSLEPHNNTPLPNCSIQTKMDNPTKQEQDSSKSWRKSFSLNPSLPADIHLLDFSCI